LEFYGKTNFLKGGLVFSDAVTTVSERYSHEIQTEEFGCGLEGALREKAGVLYGILNGIDYEDWNPERDSLIKFNYSYNNLEDKWKNKEYLERQTGLAPERTVPLIGMVGRLVDQKGLDILSEILDDVFKIDLQMIILGTGIPKYHELLKNFSDKFKDRLSLHIKFDNSLAHQIYAGSDIFLMPSRFEPCGLGQMISFRYGTIPLVRETGGLADTVIDVVRDAEKGNGFSFSEYSGRALLEKIQDACSFFRSKGEAWRRLMERGMAIDFSWRNSTGKYLDLYRKLLANG
jgi:starch synthase